MLKFKVLKNCKTMVKSLFFLLLSSDFIIAVEYSKSNEGHVNGFEHDCPEWLETSIDRSRLKDLVISVMGPGNTLTAKMTPYNYYRIRDLAQNPDMDFSKKTFLFVRSNWEEGVYPLVKNMGPLYRDMGYNVLILKSLKFTGKSYRLSLNVIRPIGKRVAEMLANLTAVGLDPQKLELVAHGLGGHTMSFIAKNYRQITGRNISSLTGLDPAGPCFRHLGPEERLDPSDADFVLSIATNMDGLGIASPVGKVTFYVNGGEYQPADSIYGHLSPILCTVDCSHMKAIHYWISAIINPGTFIGIKCDTIQQAREGDCYDIKPMVTNTMDVYSDRSKPGVYYLPTLNNYPYGVGTKALKKGYDAVANYLAWMNRKEIIKVG